MPEWKLSPAKLKNYPHFDKPLSLSEASNLASDPERVKSHGFFPFIKFEKRWTRFRHKGEDKKHKIRPLRYAARSDSYIYIRYRDILSKRYEAKLAQLGISENVIAYRKIPIGHTQRGGKCNIHFSKEAFQFIRNAENCCAVTLDISSYFDCIDHARLKETWKRLLGTNHLPDDHFQVFKSITSYAEVDRDALYERLEFLKRDKNGRPTYIIPKSKMPRQLCSPAEFRSKIASDGPHGPKLIKVNRETFGIPQGAAISDLLANAYLLEFDIAMAAYAQKRNGFYRRYSDDILIVVPGDGRAGRGARDHACALIKKFGDKLSIKAEKSNTVRFTVKDGQQRARRANDVDRVDGLEYLGFRFDGRYVYFRDSTLSNLNRKISRAARAVSYALVARFPGKDLTFLRTQLNVEAFMARFGRVKDFDPGADYASWTFWSYARKAAQVFGTMGVPLFHQLKRQRADMRRLLDERLADALRT